MGALAFLLEREVIIALALSGGVIATVGSFLIRRKSEASRRRTRFILRFGYVLTFVSVGLFIAAGFAAAYRD